MTLRYFMYHGLDMYFIINFKIMKLIILFFFISLASFSQTLQVQTVFDTTRADGQRFIVTYPFDCTIHLEDSIGAPNYYSLENSYVVFTVNRLRIVSGDTLSRGESIIIPLNAIGNNAVQFLTGAPTRKQVKKQTKPWISRKLNEE